MKILTRDMWIDAVMPIVAGVLARSLRDTGPPAA